MSKASSKGSETGGAKAGGTVADQVAEFIGRSLGDLLNRRDSLSKQMAEVEQQIADVRHRVVRQFGEYLPTPRERRRAKKAVARKVKAVRNAAREISEETRKKMAEAAKKRWARERARKGR